MRFPLQMSQMALAGTALVVVVAAIALAVYAVLKTPKAPLKLLIVGQPRTGKTTLFHHLIHDERPKTFKSAKITDFTGHILCNTSRIMYVIDVPSDVRCGEPDGDIGLICLESADKQAAELVAKWFAKCKLGVYILRPRDSYFDALISQEIAKYCGLEHVQLPENVRFVQCDFTDKWDTAYLEKVLAQL